MKIKISKILLTTFVIIFISLAFIAVESRINQLFEFKETVKKEMKALEFLQKQQEQHIKLFENKDINNAKVKQFIHNEDKKFKPYYSSSPLQSVFWFIIKITTIICLLLLLLSLVFKMCEYF